MKLISKITDVDIVEKVYGVNTPTTRKAIRSILLNNLGQITLLHKSKKNEYKLVIESYDKLVSSKYDNLYSSKFVIKRNEAILK